jgi:hypothetical protein
VHGLCKKVAERQSSSEMKVWNMEHCEEGKTRRKLKDEERTSNAVRKKTDVFE